MKNILIIPFTLLSLFIYSQEYCLCRENIYFNAGLNIVDNSGDQNVFDIMSNSKKRIFQSPLDIGFNYNFAKKFEVQLNLSTNIYNEGDIIDSIKLSEKLSYFAVDIGIKYYLYDFKINGSSTLRFYTTSGIGLFQLNKEYTGSFNIGGGLQYWFNKDWGLYINSLGKFSLNQRPLYSNHLQHSIGFVFSIFN